VPQRRTSSSFCLTHSCAKARGDCPPHGRAATSSGHRSNCELITGGLPGRNEHAHDPNVQRPGQRTNDVDIVDTAGTLCSAAVKLKEGGARTVSAYITHPVLSGNAIKNIEDSVLDEIVVTNTIPLQDAAKNCKKVRQLCLAELLAQAIRRINIEESVSSLFVE